MQHLVPSGPELRKLRLAAGVSATDVARSMGVGQPTISKLETEVHQPRPKTVLRYLEALVQAQVEQRARAAAFRKELARLADGASS